MNLKAYLGKQQTPDKEMTVDNKGRLLTDSDKAYMLMLTLYYHCAMIHAIIHVSFFFINISCIYILFISFIIIHVPCLHLFHSFFSIYWPHHYQELHYTFLTYILGQNNTIKMSTRNSKKFYYFYTHLMGTEYE
jgi:hypothetical protein